MELITLLERMKMEHLLARLDGVCEHAAQGDADYKTFLTHALEAEWHGRYQKGVEGRLKQARLPWQVIRGKSAPVGSPRESPHLPTSHAWPESRSAAWPQTQTPHARHRQDLALPPTRLKGCHRAVHAIRDAVQAACEHTQTRSRPPGTLFQKKLHLQTFHFLELTSTRKAAKREDRDTDASRNWTATSRSTTIGPEVKLQRAFRRRGGCHRQLGVLFPPGDAKKEQGSAPKWTRRRSTIAVRLELDLKPSEPD
jgi:hypothetical protein